MYNNPVNDQNTSLNNRNNTYPMYYQATNTMQIHSQTPFSNVNHGFDDDDDDGDGDEFPRKGERFPQWGHQETKDLIEIRAQLEWDNNASKRRKNMWETVVNRMRDKGYLRTSEQCKGKWKNLVNRYKNHNPDPDNPRQFPFFNEMVAVFTVRANRTQPADQLADQRKPKKRSKSAISPEDSSEDELDDDEDKETDTIQTENTSNDPNARSVGSKRQKHQESDKNPMKKNTLAGIEEMVKNFVHEQKTIDMKWRELYKRREQERDVFEQEWRDNMKKLEKERLDMHRAWRERDEQRRVQEQSRAEKRDEILTLILRRMTRDNN